MKKLLLVLFFVSFVSFGQARKIKEPLIHTVLFWLNNPESEKDRLAFESAIQELIETNPQGIQSHIGKPAETSQREVVDSSYTYLYLITFSSLEAEAAYQNDPTHINFIEKAKHLWKKVVVYDSDSLNSK
ncbi:MAG: Dabb family protein [Candidatus Marivariicella sp.]|tara:strand:- start:1350 stop:1739 length:390 start_codon:yes stop_codon:yes gene_type:complete